MQFPAADILPVSRPTPKWSTDQWWYEFVNPNCTTDPIEAEADPAEDPTVWSEDSAESVDVIGIGALGDATGTSGGKISPH